MFLTVLKKPLQSKALLVMKLTMLLMLFFTLNVSANWFWAGQDQFAGKKDGDQRDTSIY